MPHKRSDQCSIPNAHLMRIEHWELSIGQIFYASVPEFAGSRSQIQDSGTNSVVRPAIKATAVKPAESKADAETMATEAMPSWEAAFRTAMYSPRISGPTISVVSACKGA